MNNIELEQKLITPLTGDQMTTLNNVLIFVYPELNKMKSIDDNFKKSNIFLK